MLRALIAYSGAVGIVGIALALSIAHGAGWKPALAGMPLYVILFVGITYQLIKELLVLKKSGRTQDDNQNDDAAR
nr:hypothetical protein [Burkholderia sp. THE68]